MKFLVSIYQDEDGVYIAECPSLRAEYDTSAVPGRFFEMPTHFRIGMGVNSEMFAEGLRRMGEALRA